MIELLLLSFALSMDAFAVSIGLGSKKNHTMMALPLKAGVFFGAFQALMPLIGYLGGQGLVGFASAYVNWIAFGLLALIGAKMMYEGFNEGIEEEIQTITHKLLLTLAIATSMDAMAAGFSVTLLPINPFLAFFITGMITLVMSFIGVFIGKISGAWLESKAQIFGGVVLVIVGFRLLFF